MSTFETDPYRRLRRAAGSKREAPVAGRGRGQQGGEVVPGGAPPPLSAPPPASTPSPRSDSNGGSRTATTSTMVSVPATLPAPPPPAAPPPAPLLLLSGAAWAPNLSGWGTALALLLAARQGRVQAEADRLDVRALQQRQAESRLLSRELAEKRREWLEAERARREADAAKRMADAKTEGAHAPPTGMICPLWF